MASVRYTKYPQDCNEIHNVGLHNVRKK